jgi:hypothetical protein
MPSLALYQSGISNEDFKQIQDIGPGFSRGLRFAATAIVFFGANDMIIEVPRSN